MFYTASQQVYNAANELAKEIKKPENAIIYAAMEGVKKTGKPLAFKEQLFRLGSSAEAWDSLIRRVTQAYVVAPNDLFWIGAMAYAILFEDGVQLYRPPRRRGGAWEQAPR